MDNGKTEKIIIIGGAGSGKDHLRKELVKLGLKYSPKFTTRPMRVNEIQGEDYDFINEERYLKLLGQNSFKTKQSFFVNGQIWYYGITKENWEKNQVFIMTTEELSQLTTQERKESFVVYLRIRKEIRIQRLLERSDNNDSIQRRIESDGRDFASFKDYDLLLTDENFDCNFVYDLMN